MSVGAQAAGRARRAGGRGGGPLLVRMIYDITVCHIISYHIVLYVTSCLLGYSILGAQPVF